MARRRLPRRSTDVHWTQIGRALATELQNAERPQRIARVKDEASSRGLSAHTIHRYIVLAEFLNRLNVDDVASSRLGVAQMEVILRIWAMDPNAAVSALRGAERGTLSFRDALEMERKIKRRVQDTGGAKSKVETLPQDDQFDFAQFVLGMDEADPLDDPRFAFAQVHRIFVSATRRVALIDETLASSGAGFGFEFPALARAILEAASLFDHVVVEVAKRASAERLFELLDLCAPSVRDRISLDMKRLNEHFLPPPLVS